ncbi:MAG: hypothetical protein H6Q51_62 [Deltaproteobacteria bacterium]|jgi:hypothetical protein|nr:hypothetical protein [Deltaproteobacteria bacterium]
MAKDHKTESYIQQAKDYIARYEAIKAKYPNARRWEDFSGNDLRELSELMTCAEEFLISAVKRKRIPKELAKHLAELLKWNDSLGYELGGE